MTTPAVLRTDPEIRLRLFRPEDLPVIREIAARAFDGVGIDQGMEAVFGLVDGHDWQWRKARHIDDDARRDPEGIFVAETADGRIIGTITTWRDREAGIGHIPNIALDAEWRNLGLGRLMIEHVLDHFRDSGLTHARIETLAQNARGKHLYESCGFREIARQIHFAADLHEPARPTGAPDLIDEG
ncbi:MAG: GNAT family N-acetyltransferase [Planctomycetaceae bacterium]